MAFYGLTMQVSTTNFRVTYPFLSARCKAIREPIKKSLRRQPQIFENVTLVRPALEHVYGKKDIDDGGGFSVKIVS